MNPRSASASLGATDCELLRDGLLAQPVNAVSSLAYVAAGVWVWSRARDTRGTDRTAAFVFGAALAAVGVGSVAYHGPQPAGARWVHDASILAAPWWIALHNTATRRAWRPSSAGRIYAVGLAALGALVGVRPDVGPALTALLAGAAIATEAVARPAVDDQRRRAQVLVSVLLAAGFGAFVFGRTDASLCRPTSLLQGHAAWHALTAAAMAAWAWGALGRGGATSDS
jgi:hypothetical protein